MKRCIVFVVLTAGATWGGPLQAGEARYEGKPLGYWIDRLQKSETNEDRRTAAAALATFGADAVPALMEMLDDGSEDYRWIVASALCEIGPKAKSAVPALVRSLKEKTARSPKLVIQILEKIGPDAKDAAPLLIQSTEDPDLADVAVPALCAVEPPAGDAIPAIRRAIRFAQSHDDGRVYGLIEPLSKLGGDCVPLLLELMGDEDPVFKESSAKTLGKVGPAAKTAVPALTKLLDYRGIETSEGRSRDLWDTDACIRGDAAIALWEIDKNTDGIPVLAASLKSPARYLAEPAAQTLGDMGAEAKSALPALEEARSHSIPEVREAVKLAIHKIDPEGAKRIKDR